MKYVAPEMEVVAISANTTVANFDVEEDLAALMSKLPV